RSRSSRFGHALREPLVSGKDAVFFVTYDPNAKELLCDCVFVIAETLPIREAEAKYSIYHPVRHYHFDQDRNPSNKNSILTRVAEPEASFIPHPPARIGDWIESHVRNRKLTVGEYFSMKKRKNVRVITRDAQGIYDRINIWSCQPGHQKLSCLP